MASRVQRNGTNTNPTGKIIAIHFIRTWKTSIFIEGARKYTLSAWSIWKGTQTPTIPIKFNEASQRITSAKMDFASSPSSPAIGAVIPHRSAVTSLSYHNDGIHLFAATESDSRLCLINSQTGKSDQSAIKCEREGVSLVSSTWVRSKAYASYNAEDRN